MTAWKNHERFVAKALQGFRIPRGANFSDSLPDVVAASSKTLPGTDGLILGECKYSQNHPWVSNIQKQYKKTPIIIKTDIDDLILFELRDIDLLLNITLINKTSYTDMKVPGYMIQYLNQSRDYIKNLTEDLILKATISVTTGLTDYKGHLPIVVMAKKRNPFRLAYTSKKDLEKFLHLNDIHLWRI